MELRLGAKSWAIWVGVLGSFLGGSGRSERSSFAISSVLSRGWGVGGCDPHVDRHIVEHCIYFL